ncbi:MAG TPA: AI-2E family transporter [Pyrinomonadaceae bacterium]|nr:AI-2E family transporter [Pyrinomonadaceae bacterium]
MATMAKPASELKRDAPSSLWDTLIRVSLIAALGFLCFQVLSPFLRLIVWSIILAVTIYPLHQLLARRLGGRQKLTSTLLVILALLLVVIPTALLMNSFADSIQKFVGAVHNNTLQIPAPREGIKNWPVAGAPLHDLWSKAHADMPGLVQNMQPKIADLARSALSVVANIGGTILLFLGSFLVANIVMAYGESASRGSRAFFHRIAGSTRGEALVKLSVATIRAVALGVIGVAAIQAIFVGLALLLAHIPVAGVLAIVVLVLAIAQLPASLVTIPVIIYIWTSGGYSHGAAIAHTIILLLVGLVDNVLKPLMLGRGVDVPMPVILLGALGGMASGGILGMFVGATVLALGYEIVKNWVAINSESVTLRPAKIN